MTAADRHADSPAAALARIRSALDPLAPVALELVDESHLHAGHDHPGSAGYRPGRLSHLRVRIVSEAFRGESRIARHCRVNALLEGEIARGLHALAIEARAPGE